MSVSPGEPSCAVQWKIRRRNAEMEKPCVSDVYMANMGGTDKANQLCSFYYMDKQSIKWHRYVF